MVKIMICIKLIRMTSKDSMSQNSMIKSFPYLRHLKFSSSDDTKFINDMNKEDIINIKPGDTVYVDIASRMRMARLLDTGA